MTDETETDETPTHGLNHYHEHAKRSIFDIFDGPLNPRSDEGRGLLVQHVDDDHAPYGPHGPVQEGDETDVEFGWRLAVWHARQHERERLAVAAALAPGAYTDEGPVVAPPGPVTLDGLEAFARPKGPRSVLAIRSGIDVDTFAELVKVADGRWPGCVLSVSTDGWFEVATELD